MRVKRARMLTLTSLLLFSLIAGCSGQRAAPTGANTQPGDVAPKELKKAKVIYTIENLIFMPLFIAVEKGYFKNEGVDVELLQMAGGDAMAALLSGSVDAVAGNGNSVTTSRAKNISELIAVGNVVSNVTSITAIRKEVWAAHKLRADLPVAERLKALKGVTFGVTGAGSADDNLLSLYLEKAGLQRDKDVTVVAMGSGANMQAAFSKNQIQAFMASPTLPNDTVKDGSGELLVLGGEVEGTQGISWDALITRRALISKDESLVRGIARAIARGNNFSRDTKNLDELVVVARRRFPKTDEALLKAGLAYMIKAEAWPLDAAMDEQVWKNQLALDRRAGSVTVDLDTKEGVLWTNKFVGDVGGKSD